MLFFFFLQFQREEKCNLIDSETYQIAHSEKEERTHMTALCNGLGASDQSCTVRYGTNCVVFELKKAGLHEYQSRFHTYHYILVMLND